MPACSPQADLGGLDHGASVQRREHMETSMRQIQDEQAQAGAVGLPAAQQQHACLLSSSWLHMQWYL